MEGAKVLAPDVRQALGEVARPCRPVGACAPPTLSGDNRASMSEPAEKIAPHAWPSTPLPATKFDESLLNLAQRKEGAK